MSDNVADQIDAATVSNVKRMKTAEVETEFVSGMDLKAQAEMSTLAALRRARSGGQSIAQRIID
jgi:hypothetical protein